MKMHVLSRNHIFANIWNVIKIGKMSYLSKFLVSGHCLVILKWYWAGQDQKITQFSKILKKPKSAFNSPSAFYSPDTCKPIRQVYEDHEAEKKRHYNERVIQVEKGSFTPIVMSTFGGAGEEAEKHHKRVATLIAQKRNERYSDVINYIRTRLRFCLLRSVLLAIRGVRGKSLKEKTESVASISFNLVENGSTDMWLTLLTQESSRELSGVWCSNWWMKEERQFYLKR